MDDYAGWITKQEALTLTGWKERTLERYLTNNFIQRATRSLPGTRPVTILNPDQIRELLAQQQQAAVKTPEVLKTKERKDTRDVTLARRPPSHVRQLAATAPPVPIERKLFLTVAESVQYSGLTDSYLRRAIRDGQLAAIRNGGYKIKRIDLERLGG
jgi:hypothetical protein